MQTQTFSLEYILWSASELNRSFRWRGNEYCMIKALLMLNGFNPTKGSICLEKQVGKFCKFTLSQTRPGLYVSAVQVF